VSAGLGVNRDARHDRSDLLQRLKIGAVVKPGVAGPDPADVISEFKSTAPKSHYLFCFFLQPSMTVSKFLDPLKSYKGEQIIVEMLLKAGLLQPVQVHVQQRPGDAQPASELADVHPAAGQLGNDPQPQRIGYRRQHGHQLCLSGQRRLLALCLSPVR
jgi:hypothetical protein